MTDRELLELAAKAAGYSGKRATAYGVVIMEAGYDAEPLYWNPLTSDGDALRLAVSLRLWIQTSDRCAWAQQDAESILGEAAASSMVMLSDVGNDPYAATRRAIVRAAAEIGRTMP